MRLALFALALSACTQQTPIVVKGPVVDSPLVPRQKPAPPAAKPIIPPLGAVNAADAQAKLLQEKSDPETLPKHPETLPKH